MYLSVQYEHDKQDWYKQVGYTLYQYCLHVMTTNLGLCLSISSYCSSNCLLNYVVFGNGSAIGRLVKDFCFHVYRNSLSFVELQQMADVFASLIAPDGGSFLILDVQ